MAIRDGRVVLQGHGLRQRSVVLPGEARAALTSCWVRRFRCTACTCTCTVRPPGVLAGLYSLYAILTAWWLATRTPVGEGLDDKAVYARQGVDRLTPEAHHYGRPRWRSLGRWADQLGSWWPGRGLIGSTWRARVEALLVGLRTAHGEAWLGQAVRGAAM